MFSGGSRLGARCRILLRGKWLDHKQHKMGCRQRWQVRCGQSDRYEQFWFGEYLGFSNDGNRRPAHANTDGHADSDSDRNAYSHRDADSDSVSDSDSESYSHVVRARNTFHHGSSNDERQKSWPGNYGDDGNVVTRVGVSKLRSHL